jgi:hypothetical protein
MSLFRLRLSLRRYTSHWAATFRRFDLSVSARYPFVWRTRLILWVALGVALSAAVGTYAHRMPLATHNAPRLSATLTMLSWWSWLNDSVLLLLVIDVRRTVGLITSWSQGFRLFLCVTIAAFAIALPPYIFVRLALPRVAALETSADLATLLKMHRPHHFWRCQEPQALRTEVSENRARIESDLLRYGLDTDFTLDSGYNAGCEGHRYEYALSAHVQPRVNVQIYHVSDIGVFQERVEHVEAAQRYVSNYAGAYDMVASRLGPIILLSCGVGLTATIASYTLLASFRLIAAGRQQRARFGRLSLDVGSRWDAYVASRWPAVWASRTLVTPALVAVPVALVYGSRSDVVASNYVLVLAIVLMTVAARAQTVMRNLPSQLRDEIAAYLLHAFLFVGVTYASAVFLRSLGYKPNSFVDHENWRFDFPVFGAFVKEDVLMTALGAFIFSSMLQAARNASIYATFIGCVSSAIIVTIGAWLASFKESNRQIIVMATMGAAIVVVAITVFNGARSAMRPFVQRVSLAALTVQTSLFTSMLSLSLYDSASEITPFLLAAAVAINLSATILVLRLTEHPRRTLSFIGK